MTFTATAAPADLDRMAARETVYRLAAALFGYPLEETQEAMEDGRVHTALAPAWETLTGKRWPLLPSSPDLVALQVGYTDTFLQGRRGRPPVPLVANAYEELLGGLTPGSYLLNVQAFYSNFGLQAAQGDEGHAEEPDHLVAMLEFCCLLCHLEHRALVNEQDPTPYRRAHRDFIARYLLPLLTVIKANHNTAHGHGLDQTLTKLVDVLPDWATDQQAALEAQVGPCPLPGAANTDPAAEARPLWD